VDDAGAADKSTSQQHYADEGITAEGRGALSTAMQGDFTQPPAQLCQPAATKTWLILVPVGWVQGANDTV